jgi:hypothetical protein
MKANRRRRARASERHFLIPKPANENAPSTLAAIAAETTEARKLLGAVIEGADYLGWTANVGDGHEPPRVFVLLTLDVGTYKALVNFGAATADLEEGVDAEHDDEDSGIDDERHDETGGREDAEDDDPPEDDDPHDDDYDWGLPPSDPAFNQIVDDLDRDRSANLQTSPVRPGDEA